MSSPPGMDSRVDRAGPAGGCFSTPPYRGPNGNPALLWTARFCDGLVTRTLSRDRFDVIEAAPNRMRRRAAGASARRSAHLEYRPIVSSMAVPVNSRTQQRARSRPFPIKIYAARRRKPRHFDYFHPGWSRAMPFISGDQAGCIQRDLDKLVHLTAISGMI